MPPKDRHKGNPHPLKPVQRGQRSAAPASGGGQHIRPVGSPSSDLSPSARGAPEREHELLEEALREKEHPFRLIAGASCEVIWDWDLTTGRIWRNEGMQKLFGHAPSERGPRLTWWHERVHPEDRERSHRGLYASISTGADSWFNEYRFRREDGSYADVQERDYIIRDSEGKPVRLIGGMWDITERKRAEEALRESEQRYRQLVELSPYGIAVHGDGEILYANAAVARLLGVSSPDELIGKPMWGFIHPNYRQAARARIEKSWQEEGTVDFVEQKLVRLDGQVIDTESVAFPIAHQGELARQVIVTDVTERKRAEEALRESEERFRLIAKATSDVIWDWDIRTGRVWRNEGMQRLFWYAPSEEGPQVTWWYERVHPEDRERSNRGFLATISAGGESWFNEYRFRRADGSYAYVQERDYVIRDSNGKPVRMIGGMTDITERKRTEEALRESEERFRLIARATSDAIFDCDVATGRVWWSEGVRTLFGFEPGDAALDTDWWRDQIHPDDRDRVVAATRAFLQGRGEVMTEEYRFRRADGSYAYVVDYSQFIRDEAGVAVRLIGGLRDITWRKEAEEALRESEERFRQVAETSREWIWEFDAEGRYTYCNPGVKDIFGYAPEELIGKPYWHLLTPEDRDRLRPVAVDILARRDSFFRLVNANVHKDGHTVVIESTGRPIFDAEGALVGYRGVDQDITARKLAEQALRESEERFRELAESIRDVFFAMDKDLKYTYWNKASEDLTGISAEDAIGKSLYEVFPDVKGTRAEEVYLEVLRTQEPRTFVTEYRLGGKDFFFEISVYPSRAGLSVFVKDVSARKRAEEALRRREQEISVLADNVPTLFSYVDSDGCYRFANQRYEEWFGVPRTAIVGRHLTQVLGEATYERIRDHVERVLLGEHVHFEDVLPYKIAGTRWVSADYVPDTNDRGEVKGFFALIVDMTERKRAEEALRESERRYRLLAENARDVIWTVDMNLRTTYVSPSVTHLWGYSVEEIMTRTVDQMLTPASLDVAMEALAEELAAESTGQIDPSRSRTLELESVCRDGSTIWTEAKMSALRDERGRLVGILGVSRDITERKRAQTILKASERRYRLLAENASDIIWIRDLDLRAMYVNPAVTRIRGYSVEEVMAQTPEEILTPASLEFAREVLAEEVAKDQVEERDLFWWRTLELENICKDGSTVWLEERVTALRDDDKRIVGILGISRDISERKRAEEALQKAREELETRVEHRMRRGSAHGLTFRELTVLHLVAAGESNKEIAATLGISTLTASKHLANILHKMGAASRTEAGVRAVKEGLLD